MKEQTRLRILNAVLGKQCNAVEAAQLIGVSERHLWRILAAYRKEGAAALAHGNRSRLPANATSSSLKAQVMALVNERYQRVNHTHLAELLAEHEGIVLSRSTVRRFLTSAGISSSRHRRSPRHRYRRERMPQEGMLVQIDGSRHRWLEERGPWLNLLLSVDDATGSVPFALFQMQEDTEGYFRLLQGIIRQKGIPLALYSDRYFVFRYNGKKQDTAEESQTEKSNPTQFGRAMRELGATQIFARSPEAKAAVEGTVGVISTFILATLRNQQFLSLQELNEAVWDRLYELNHKPFQKKTGSRASAFEEEKLFLLPLPGHPFELATWRIATVQYNYHISVDMHNYSCPYEYIKQKVDVRMTRGTVEIFFEGNRIASHPRLYGRPNQHSTLEAHMPPDHQKYVRWNGERFINWAKQVGSNTTSVIQLFLDRYAVEQQGYKSCMALLKLTDKYSPQRLEAACTKAFSFTVSPSLKSIQSILRSGQDKLPEQEEKPSSASEYGFTRGAEYYDGRTTDAD